MSQRTERYIILIKQHLKDGAAIYHFDGKHLVEAEFLTTGYYITQELLEALKNEVDLHTETAVNQRGKLTGMSYMI